ncbi:zinc finger protein rotund-like isoform X2 [Homalodisca vitripennis]|uniref:zinc finger protein rotund-like isoform X2 n=1 Tax=Homalodisca vitripennis TaxID=197043 RepID=UPI001EEABA85|nr:zinc finger protein rotund-like isoform X2 [Homalodisca vitripennis]
MYPWYRESVSQFCGTASPMPTTIKTENGYNDCMLALDYAAQSKKAAFVWEGSQHGGGGGGGPGVSGGHGKCGGPAGGQGQGGLVHWMSAVMAEHMNNVSTNHHDGIHYMWNSGVEQCGPHAKDMDYSWGRQTMAKQGYEAKMSTDQQNSHGVEDGRMDPPGTLGLYGGAVRSHSSSSSSASPPHGAATLIVPHPLAASKDQHHVVTHNGSGRKYQCKMCPQIFGSKSELQMHSQLHMREVKPYKCSQCSKTFANSSYLSQHTRIHLGIKPYRCDICQRKFTQLSHLQQHIRTHTGDKPYKCRHPGCNKAFSQLSNLQSHSRCHQTDKPYKCNSCYKCFADEPSLLEHIPKHKESKHLKTHICQYCGKSYTQETYLTKHMQKHAERTDKRPPIIGIPRVTFETPHYWPKVSPDTANTLVDAMSQQDYHQANGLLQDHMNGEDHSGRPPAPTPTPGAASPGNYHDVKTNTSSASAFTPIQSMVPTHHHNHHLNHNQISDPRPAYLSYNALAFPGAAKVVTSSGQLQGLSGGVQTSVAVEMPKSMSTNSFPNQLISLHQIRNYAHQPAPSLMSTEHLLTGLKDKTQ